MADKNDDAGKMDRNLALEAVRVTEAAALAASKLMGRGDEKMADQAAVDAMRTSLNSLNIEGTVVIGEGERDEADIEQARRWAAQPGFDAILSTDGDGDRPLVGDENGRWLRGDLAGILCAQYLQAHAVVSTVSCNTALELCGTFAEVRRTRIGSPYVIEAMEGLIATGWQRVVGFEPNGGFLLGSAIEKNGRVLAPLMTRDAILPVLCLLSLARAQRVPLSALAPSLPARFTASDRLQSFPTETSRALVAQLAASSAAVATLLAGIDGKARAIDQTDGLRIVLENGEIVHFRPSGNAPELRCYAEAATAQRAAALVALGLRRMQAMAASARD